jgi:hypothetical protein
MGADVESDEQQAAGGAGKAGLPDAGITPATEERMAEGYPAVSNEDEGKLDLSGD